MNGPSPSRPPYLDWRLDLWKLALLVVLFAVLLAWALWGGSATAVHPSLEMASTVWLQHG